MPSKIGKQDISILKGRITNDSYEETIKKLSIASQKQFVQLVPSNLVAGENHLALALEQTFDAFEKGINFAKKPGLEFIIRLLAEKQLNKALGKAGFEKGVNLVLVIGSQEKKVVEETKKALGFEEQDFKLGGNKDGLMKVFKISQNELDTLFDLENPLEEIVIERVSFVALER